VSKKLPKDSADAPKGQAKKIKSAKLPIEKIREEAAPLEDAYLNQRHSTGENRLAPEGRNPDGTFLKGGPGPNPNPEGPRPVMTIINLASKFREVASRADLWGVLWEIATNQRKANREQMEAIKIILERGWGRSPETHLIATMSQEQTAAVGALTQEQLIGLLDTSRPKPALAARTATLESEVIESTAVAYQLDVTPSAQEPGTTEDPGPGQGNAADVPDRSDDPDFS
jgi:hypothetical protein